MKTCRSWRIDGRTDGWMDDSSWAPSSPARGVGAARLRRRAPRSRSAPGLGPRARVEARPASRRSGPAREGVGGRRARFRASPARC
eukprot:scaffold1121_cov317-Prasinococcus_capsulatus_cf.AAC.2